MNCRLLAPLCLFALAACAAPPARHDPALVVRKGEFVERMLLTGEMMAVRIEVLSVPRVPSWQTTIRWLLLDGSAVKAGDRVAELDSTEFSSDIEELKLEALKSHNEFGKTQADQAAREAERAAEVERRRTALEKAQAAADVPDTLLPRRERQERVLALERARTEHAKAVADLDAQRRAAAAELDVARLKVEKAESDRKEYEQGLGSLVVTAPRDGIVLISRHWEGRKLQVGDSAFVGMALATLPDLGEMAVEAQLWDVDDGRVAPGMPVLATLDPWPEERFPGHVVEVTPIAKEAEAQSLRRVFRVRILLDQVDRERMRPGMSVRAEVLTRKLAGALLAPRAGLDLAGLEPRARLAGGQTRPVRLGPCNALECVIEEGLEEGARLGAGGAA